MEWKEYILDDICNISIGRTPPRNEHEWFNQTTPSYKWVSIKDMGECGKYISKTSETISMVGQERFRIPIVPPHTILLSFKLTVGRIAITGNDPMLTNEAIAQLPIKDENVVNQDYLYYYLKIFNYGLLGNTSSIANAVNSKTIRKIHIPLPPLETQRRIAAILSSLDDKIENNNRINANLESQAQALFKSWFIDFEPWDGVMPDDWKETSLSSIAEYLNGLAMQKFPALDIENSLPVLKIKELGQKHCDESSDSCSKDIKPDYIIHDGDVIFSWSGTLLVDIWCGGECGLNQHLFKVTSDKYPKWFYYLWTKQHLENFKHIASDKAVTMGHIKRGDLDKSMVLIPNNETLDYMTSSMTPLLDNIISNAQESLRLATLRDTLLPKLMKGEIAL